MAREHPHNFVREAARRERQAWLSFTAVMILIIAIAFLWWTW